MAKYKKVVRVRNQQKTSKYGKWPPTFKLGMFTASKIKLQEAAINDLVLRVTLKAVVNKEKRKRGRPPKINHIRARPILKTKGSKNQVRTKVAVKTGALTKPVPANSLQATYLKKVKNKFNNNDKKPLINNNRSNKMCKQLSPKFKQYWNVCGAHTQSKLTVDFTKLAEHICALKLPSPSWHVTVMMNHELTTMFKFHNNPMKSVTFSQPSTLCNIIMNDVPVVLLGCPKTVSCMQDLEILLEIVNRLDLQDCMVTKYL